MLVINTQIVKSTAIHVWANIADKEECVESNFYNLGAIELEREELLLRIDRQREAIPLEDESSRHSLEINDTASCNLIESIVSKHQKLGGLAVNTAGQLFKPNRFIFAL